MPETKQRTEMIVGAFVLMGLALLGFLVFQFGAVGSRKSDGYPVSLTVRDASGLQVGAPVRLGGVDIGFVGSAPELSPSFDSLEMELRIYPDRKIPKGSEVRIGTSGIMGDGFIRIIAPSSRIDSYYAPGDHIEASGPNSIDDVATGAVDILTDAAKVLSQVGRSIEQLNETFSRFDEGVLNEENVESLGVILKDLRDSSGRIEEASERLDPLLNETENAAKEIQKTAQNANVAIEEIRGEVAGLAGSLEGVDPALKEFDTTLDDLRSTLQAADGLIHQIENGGGLASALLHDPGLRSDMSSFLDKLNRNGILLYPKEGNARRVRSESRSSPSPSTAQPQAKKKILFPWMKKKQ